MEAGGGKMWFRAAAKIIYCFERILSEYKKQMEGRRYLKEVHIDWQRGEDKQAVILFRQINVKTVQKHWGPQLNPSYIRTTPSDTQKAFIARIIWSMQLWGSITQSVSTSHFWVSCWKKQGSCREEKSHVKWGIEGTKQKWPGPTGTH